MTINLLHQVGHCPNWNLDSYMEDNCGDGLIFSPVHQNSDQIKRIDPDIKCNSFLDPQYYLPSSQKKKLHSYDFFPDVISNGFETIDYSKYARDSAARCIDYQLDNEFDRIIIPARYFDQMIPEYTQKQEAYTVRPFLEEITKANLKTPVFVTLPLTSAMIKNETYRTEILNWVTTFPEISGVYIFASDQRKRKQIQDEDFLFSYLKFCKELQQAELEIVMGYQNSEGILFTLLDNITLSMGSFENTRIFSLDKYIESDDDRRGPKPRIYLPGLFNWIQFNQAKEIKNDLPEIWEKIYLSTDYAESTFTALKDPTFNQSPLYKHYFLNYQEQIDAVNNFSIEEKYRNLRSQLKEALILYEEIDKYIDLESHGNGAHIQPWLNAINKYSRKYIKG